MATAIDKKSFMLVNRENQNPLDCVFGDSNSSSDTWNYADWDLDGNGDLRTVTGKELQVQQTLKCVFTERQGNGYGSNIYNLIGEKDVTVRRMGLFMDITMSLINMKLLQDEQKEAQNLSDNDLISTMGKLIVTEDPTNPSISKIQMSIITNNETVVDIGVL